LLLLLLLYLDSEDLKSLDFSNFKNSSTTTTSDELTRPNEI
jgi:hypothetical protein